MHHNDVSYTHSIYALATLHSTSKSFTNQIQSNMYLEIKKKIPIIPYHFQAFGILIRKLRTLKHMYFAILSD